MLRRQRQNRAVIGSPLDNILPRRNIKLAQKILDDGGLILSEYNMEVLFTPSKLCS